MSFSGLRKTVTKTIQTVSSNKILNNDILYKVVVVLALLNVISYIVSKNVNAVIAFTLVYLATNYFTKNMTIVLLAAVFATNFLIVTNKIKESFDGEGKDNMDLSGENINEKPETDSDESEPVVPSEVPSELMNVLNNSSSTDTGNGKKTEVEKYANIAHKLKPTDIAPVEFNADSAELTKQLKILNERTKNSMGMINKLGGIANIGKMIDSLTGIVNKLN